MFITAVCVIFLINLASFQNKSFIVTKEKTNSPVLTVFSTSFFCSPLSYLLVLFAFFTVFYCFCSRPSRSWICRKLFACKGKVCYACYNPSVSDNCKSKPRFHLWRSHFFCGRENIFFTILNRWLELYLGSAGLCTLDRRIFPRQLRGCSHRRKQLLGSSSWSFFCIAVHLVLVHILCS